MKKLLVVAVASLVVLLPAWAAVKAAKKDAVKAGGREPVLRLRFVEKGARKQKAPCALYPKDLEGKDVAAARDAAEKATSYAESLHIAATKPERFYELKRRKGPGYVLLAHDGSKLKTLEAEGVEQLIDLLNSTCLPSS